MDEIPIKGLVIILGLAIAPPLFAQQGTGAQTAVVHGTGVIVQAPSYSESTVVQPGADALSVSEVGTAPIRMAADDPFRFAGLKIYSDRVEGRILGRTGNQGLSGVTVRLLDPDGVMMEVTKTDKRGFFKIDLGTLDNAELKSIKKFSLEVTDAQGRSSRRSLAKAAKA